MYWNGVPKHTAPCMPHGQTPNTHTTVPTDSRTTLASKLPSGKSSPKASDVFETPCLVLTLGSWCGIDVLASASSPRSGAAGRAPAKASSPHARNTAKQPLCAGHERGRWRHSTGPARSAGPNALGSNARPAIHRRPTSYCTWPRRPSQMRWVFCVSVARAAAPASSVVGVSTCYNKSWSISVCICISISICTQSPTPDQTRSDQTDPRPGASYPQATTLCPRPGARPTVGE